MAARAWAWKLLLFPAAVEASRGPVRRCGRAPLLAGVSQASSAFACCHICNDLQSASMEQHVALWPLGTLAGPAAQPPYTWPAAGYVYVYVCCCVPQRSVCLSAVCVPCDVSASLAAACMHTIEPATFRYAAGPHIHTRHRSWQPADLGAGVQTMSVQPLWRKWRQPSITFIFDANMALHVRCKAAAGMSIHTHPFSTWPFSLQG